ncbi:hypothetical protein [Comamonas endophytica]|uniref:Uncharacterized protein n=1 Tax=Comamonas endophytica TaxID=2949090 RepID=A0ABY6GE88_9BURK|nr:MULTISPECIES: hypothetical protein [unclassified Acidovorax]MCD2511000.1 hypothetical protein [Acidovorax sp. D4N7]UYG53304.1 hypothetical protein M9799_09860 [Acidovorax sp. 5MLIR]
MDFFTLAIIVTIAVYVLKRQDQRRRTRLLAEYLGRLQIEKLMGSLIEGYLRALGESDLQRRTQVWALLEGTEKSLADQFQRFAEDFARAPAEQVRVSTLPLALPYVERIYPQGSFDMRDMVKLHARSIGAVQVHAAQDDEERRRRAFMLTAEIFLMQHSCHWFCKSLTVASVRLLARHQTSYEQVLAAVSPATRKSYLQLIGKR